MTCSYTTQAVKKRFTTVSSLKRADVLKITHLLLQVTTYTLIYRIHRIRLFNVGVSNDIFT